MPTAQSHPATANLLLPGRQHTSEPHPGVQLSPTRRKLVERVIATLTAPRPPPSQTNSLNRAAANIERFLDCLSPARLSPFTLCPCDRQRTRPRPGLRRQSAALSGRRPWQRFGHQPAQQPAASLFSAGGGTKPLENEYDPARPNDYEAIRAERERLRIEVWLVVCVAERTTELSWQAGLG